MSEENKEFVTIDGKEYEINSLPYGKALEMVREAVADILVCDEETGCTYERYDKEARLTYWFIKYATDYPIMGNEDIAWKYEFRDRVRFYFNSSVEYVMPVIITIAYDYLKNAVSKRFVESHSLSKSVLGVFKSILGDEDISKTIAESRTMSENLLDLMRKAKLFDENERDTKQKNMKQEKDFLKIFGKKDV